ncbi:hypothetical protein [Mesobacillus foraminis]|nr:hypothetical protein [Mesobacillus foraminis]
MLAGGEITLVEKLAVSQKQLPNGRMVVKRWVEIPGINIKKF